MTMKFNLFLIIPILFLLSCGSSENRTYRITITAVPSEAGKVTPESGIFEEGRSLEVSATANQHWIFSRWEGDLGGSVNPVSLTMDSDKEIAAIFIKRDYPLTVTVTGEGEVLEEVIAQRTTEYSHGTLVMLKAVPAEGWEFFGWNGDAEGDDPDIELLIEGETAVEAVFKRIEYPLTITTIGEGSVQERVLPGRTTSYEEGSLVELTAIADENWVFSQWSGDLVSTDSVDVILVDRPKSVTATFLRTFRLITIAEPGEGGGISPEEGNYVRDLSFDVTATPNSGWRFSRWEGDFTGTVNPFNLTMNGNKTITARFERLAYSLSTNVEGQGDVSVVLLSGEETPDGYLFESEVELTAEPNIGWRFVRWDGDISSTDNPLTVTMDQDLTVTALFSFFEGGTGTAEDPYQISTLSQLHEIRSAPEASYILLNSIDATATALWDGGLGFEPIGSEEQPFTGSLSGNNFSIENLTVNRPDAFYAGLFGVIEGSVSRLTIENAAVTGDERAGGVAGLNLGEISDVTVSGNVTGKNDTGGITGRNSGRIENAVSAAEISGADHTGGVTGRNEGTILLSRSSGNVSASGFRTGGFVGVNSGTITESSSTGMVSAGDIAGGFAGLNRQGGIIEYSYADGDVTGEERTGGFVGRHDDSGSRIENSYARGSVTGTSGVGGFAGTIGQNASVSRSYSTGTVTGTEDTGGFAGRNAGVLTGSYWDTAVTAMAAGVGLGTDVGVTGLLTSQMTGEQAEENMTELDWEDVWRVVAGGYPVLFWMN
ncbi:MAG: hypothetical protein EA360_04925 [Balneolaceae bacterium]|nr:MAG: hypothetical protein EA360_04925 [Balneolaceae bacterium]